VVILFSGIFSVACRSGAPGNSSVSSSNAASPTPVTEVSVKTEVAIVRKMPTYFEATGSLASDAQTDVAPVIGGRVIEVNFDVGSYVQKGSVLVRLDDSDARIRLDQAQRQVEQAVAQVEQAKAVAKQADTGISQARANLRQTQARLGVKDGETFDIERYSQVRVVKAQLDLAEKELTRFEKLLASGDVSRSAYDLRKSQRDALIPQLDEARSIAAIAVRTISTAEEGVRAAQAQAETARASVSTAQKAVETTRVQIDQVRKAINDAVILAPISGYVSERVADVGEYVNPSAPNTKICTILRTSVLRMKIDVPEQNIGQVRIGQSISLQTSAYPDRNFAGAVARIAPNLNAQSRTLTVEAEVENGGGLLKPGQFATVRIAQGKSTPTVMIPANAVRTDGEITKVFVIREERAEERIVKLGVLEGDMIAIDQGVNVDEKVATTNLGLLSDGMAVKE